MLGMVLDYLLWLGKVVNGFSHPSIHLSVAGINKIAG